MERKRPRGTPWDCALRYLGQRAHSRHELEDKLARRGFDADEVQQTMTRLDQADLLDDAQFAHDYARSLFDSKGVSKREAVRQLQKKGVATAVIDEVMEDFAASDDFTRALALAEAREVHFQGLDRQTKQRRLLGYLGRRGFSENVCYAVVRRVSEGE